MKSKEKAGSINPAPDKKLKGFSGRKPYIAYYRVSTDKQGIRGLGIEAQRTAVKNYLKDKYPPSFSFTERESGKKAHRPELDKALDLCKKKRGILIVAKLDRLSRDLHFITSLEQAKIDFICCDMPQADKFTVNILGTMAQWEREQISKRTKAALAELKKKGKKLGWHNSKVRKGLKAYWKANKKPALIGRPPKKKIIKPKGLSRADSFADKLKPVLTLLTEQGLTLEQTANKLQAMGIKTRQGHNTWRITQVVRLKKRIGL